MIDREGAAILAQVAATVFIALVVGSLVVHRESNPIRMIDTMVEVTAIVSTSLLTVIATAIAVLDPEANEFFSLLLGILSFVTVLAVGFLLNAVFRERLRRARELP